MSNYLQQIEAAYSRGRGRDSRLSPLDWDLAQKWKERDLPLHIILRAIDEAFKAHAAGNRKDSINSLRYFVPPIEKQCAEWKASQIGKSPEPEQTPIFRKTNLEEETNMQNSSVAAMSVYTAENIEILNAIAENLKPETFQYLRPELLADSVAQTRGEILALIDETRANNLSLDKIESRLTELRIGLELALIAATSDEERAVLIAESQTIHSKIKNMPGVSEKVMVRKLYQKFGLPEITLFAL